MKSLFTIVLFAFSLTIFSQESNFWNSVRFGGDFGFSLGSNNTTIAITPAAIYDFNEEFSLGGNLGYLYNKQNDFNSNIFSLGMVALFRPIPSIEFAADLKQLFVNRSFGALEDKYSYPSLNIGAAWVTGHVSLGIQYDVLFNEDKSIYANAFSPVIRIYF